MTATLLLAAALMTLGCSHPPPVAVKLADLQQCTYAGRQVIVEGWITPPYGAHNHARGEVNLFVGDANRSNGVLIRFPEGAGKNQAEPLGDGFTNESMKIHDNSGQLVTYRDRVRITGWAACDNMPPAYFPSGVTVEKLPPESK